MSLAWRRVALGFVALAFAVSVSSCKVLQRAESPAAASSSGVGAVLDAPGTTGTAACPFAAAQTGSDLGTPWEVATVPSGGCHYTQDTGTILISAVPVPKDTKGQSAALAQIRKACAADSTQALPERAGAFICQQDMLIEAAVIVGDRLVVACSAVGEDPSHGPEVRARLSALLARAV